MKYTAKEIGQQVVAGTLPVEDWNHEAHVLLCLYFASRSKTFYATLIRTRCAIIRYGAHTKGSCIVYYSETLTRFYVHTIFDFVEQAKKESQEKLTLEKLTLLAQQEAFFQKGCHYSFYSKALLESEQSRAEYLLPDL